MLAQSSTLPFGLFVYQHCVQYNTIKHHSFHSKTCLNYPLHSCNNYQCKQVHYCINPFPLTRHIVCLYIPPSSPIFYTSFYLSSFMSQHNLTYEKCRSYWNHLALFITRNNGSPFTQKFIWRQTYSTHHDFIHNHDNNKVLV